MMADSNSQPARCPCGFWGSPQTLGLCSKCYRERENRDNAQQASTNASSTTTTRNGASLETTDIQKAIASIPPSPLNASTNGESKVSVVETETETKMEDEEEEVVESKETGESSSSSSSSSSKEPSPGSKREASETEDPDRPVQKNKKRCFTCNCKLELAIREIGKCRCDYVFCQMHRLPEQHDCIFDHKSKGREEARNKMVSPKKHMGTSLKRIDSDS